MLTERENLNLVFTPECMPAWIPHMFTAYNFIVPTDVIADRPQFGVTRGKDWFGVTWIWDDATAGFVQDPHVPLVCSNVTKWERQVRFPDLDAIDWEKAAAPVVAAYDPDKWTQLMLQCGIFERTHSLLGFENTFIAMYDEPNALFDLMSAITDHRIAVMKKAAKYFKPDLITNMDDYGAQNGPLMSREMFRTHILPHGKRLGNALHELGILYQHHSCGTWDKLAPDMMEMGMRSMTAVAPTIDVDWLIREYGDQLVFDGGMDVLRVLDYPGCTEEQARKEARRAMDKFGPTGNYVAGGYCNRPMEEIVIDEVMHYGRSFYSAK